MSEKMITTLNALGLSDNEAKVYVSLLQSGPLNGYEASKCSGVPRSKVYTVLERLVSKGYCMSSNNGKVTSYKAESIEKLEQLLLHQVDRNIQRLNKEASKISNTNDDDEVWSISSYDMILLRLEEMLSEANEEILLQIWSKELSKKLESILIKKEKKIPTIVLLYDEKQEYKTEVKQVLHHGFEEEKLKEHDGHFITCVVDGKKLLSASIPSIPSASAIYTKDRSVVTFAKDYVKHDAYCLKILNKLPSEVQLQFFGENMNSIRDIFTI